ncbi:hypothetical protein PPERSA_08487 [Pseudocohnilembus persalinus]|uniref:Uncharacterized protein n=1 Tax=Pseudocohnilembus persalinus TaxID=266149 RepID=A0A0V0R6F5_PSEPJ|nr:hypothetical protein PPERSA_08487 [Pseudocohnilembus persalinus]|eukprot:KRX10084.1 hypothetical protein PPERSA_08487 [Pseudocohnilembus persalinus]
MSEQKIFWSILPLYNEDYEFQQSKFKIPFYDTKFKIQDLIERPLKTGNQTYVLAKLCLQNSSLDNESAAFHTEYEVPYIHQFDKRLKEQQEREKQEIEEKILEEHKINEKKIMRSHLLQNKRQQNSNQLLQEIQNDINRLHTSEDPYIKEKLYRKSQFPSLIEEESEINYSQEQQSETQQGLTQYQLRKLEEQERSKNLGQIKAKNYPPMKITRDDLKQSHREYQTYTPIAKNGNNEAPQSFMETEWFNLKRR